MVLGFFGPFRTRAILIAALAVLVLAAGARPFGDVPFLDVAANRVASIRDASAGDDPRVGIWSGAFRMIADRPIAGVGPGSFQAAAPSYGLYYPLGSDALLVPPHAHDLLLNIFVERGLLAVLAFIGFLGVIASHCARALRRSRGEERAYAIAISAALVAFITQGLVDYTFSTNAIALTVMALAGSAVLLEPGHMTGLRALAYCDSPIHSGAEIFLARVLADLVARPDLELVAAVPASNTRLRDALTAGGLPPQHLLESPGQPLRLSAFQLCHPRRLRRIDALIRGVRPDVLLLNVSSSEHGTAPLLTRAGARTPSVGLVHLHQRPVDFGARLPHVRERLARVAMRRLDTACTLSRPAARFTEEHWLRPGATVQLVPMPAPTLARVPRDAARARLGLDARATLVGFAGRLVLQQKGLDVFIDAAVALARTRPDVQFVIAGAGEDKAQAEQRIAAAGIARHASRCSDTSRTWAVSSARSTRLVMPSRAEGLPLLALEALSLRVPGIVSGVDGLLDVWPRRGAGRARPPRTGDAGARRPARLVAGNDLPAQ